MKNWKPTQKILYKFIKVGLSKLIDILVLLFSKCLQGYDQPTDESYNIAIIYKKGNRLYSSNLEMLV